VAEFDRRFCPDCGAAVLKGTSFCGDCGHRISFSDSASPEKPSDQSSSIRNASTKEPSPNIQVQRPYWTAAKVVGLVLVMFIAVSAVGAGVYYTLSKGQTATGGSDHSCSSGQTLVNGSCYANCSNGATNPPTCDQNSQCSDGAINPPLCTVYSSSVSLSCTPTDGFYSGNVGTGQGPFGAYCTATVTDRTIPTGTVGWSSYQALGGSSTCTLIGTSGSTSACSDTLTPAQPTNGYLTHMTVLANYQGDNSHTSSSVSSTLTAPSTVTLSGTAMYQPGCIGCSVTSVVIVNSGTHQTTTITSSTCPGNSNWCFTVSLPNLQNYTVHVYYSGTFGSGACNSVGSNPNFYVDIYQFSNTAGGNFDCA